MLDFSPVVSQFDRIFSIIGRSHDLNHGTSDASPAPPATDEASLARIGRPVRELQHLDWIDRGSSCSTSKTDNKPESGLKQTLSLE